MDSLGRALHALCVWARDLSILLFGSQNIPVLFIGGVALFIGVPALVFFSVYKIIKLVIERGKLKDQKELLALEIEKQKIQLKILEEEHKRYDCIHNKPSESSAAF
ncbi:MAG: hypothetical protein LBO67_01055 [Spirochaetaceae bacterium]|jgi:hypothetical protein|nr:hypothetical protein [Spirochaetaceae bacterium]